MHYVIQYGGNIGKGRSSVHPSLSREGLGEGRPISCFYEIQFVGIEEGDPGSLYSILMRETNPRIMQLTLIRAREFRKVLTPAERLLWDKLRKRQLVGYKFRRQHPIGSYVVDFYCPEKKLAIEVDGDSHEDREAYDRKRTGILEKYRCKVIRFTNQQIHYEMEFVLDQILIACDGIT